MSGRPASLTGAGCGAPTLSRYVINRLTRVENDDLLRAVMSTAIQLDAATTPTYTDGRIPIFTGVELVRAQDGACVRDGGPWCPCRSRGILPG